MSSKPKILNRVTVTGADDSISPLDLLKLTADYPYAEFGILLSKNGMGMPRFPSMAWLRRLPEVKHSVPLSAHVCGTWVREICRGVTNQLLEAIVMDCQFKRMQLNFHAMLHEIEPVPFRDCLRALHNKGIESFIFQFDGVNDDLLKRVIGEGINAVPLYDLSGGAGVVIDEPTR